MKSIIIHTLPKLIILGLALLNFIHIWSYQRVQTGTKISFCVYCPWYDTWSFTNEPSILFLAAFLLLLSRRWSYLIAVAFSGYVVVVGLFYLLRALINFGLFELWSGIQRSEPNIFLVSEIQLVLAGLIFSYTVFYLVLDSLHRKSLQTRFE